MGNLFTCNVEEILKAQHRILYGLVSSFNKFAEVFYGLDQNFKKAFILNNGMFKRGLGDERILDSGFFGKKNTENLKKISKIMYSDCWLGDTFISCTELNNKFECEISETTFFRLRTAHFYFRAKKGGQVTPDSSTSLVEFMNSFKKGSRYCRNILARRNKKKKT